MTLPDRVPKALSALFGTLAAYFFLGLGMLSALEFFGSPVGVGKRDIFGLVVVPVAIVLIGWAQDRIMFIVHFIASAVVWLDFWYFSRTFDPAAHLGTLSKERSFEAFSTSMSIFVICGIFASMWNALLPIRGKNASLWIPFRGKIILG